MCSLLISELVFPEFRMAERPQDLYMWQHDSLDQVSLPTFKPENTQRGRVWCCSSFVASDKRRRCLMSKWHLEVLLVVDLQKPSRVLQSSWLRDEGARLVRVLLVTQQCYSTRKDIGGWTWARVCDLSVSAVCDK